MEYAFVMKQSLNQSFLIRFIGIALMLTHQISYFAIPTHQSPTFIENKGQWPEEVLYYSALGGMDAWIVRDGIIYDFYKLERVESTEENADDFDRENEVPEFNRFGQVVSQRFVGAQELSSYEGEGKQQAYHNYFHGNDPSKWASRVGLFSEVVLKDIYPSIDLRFYFNKGQLRYDLILHPGADLDQINMRYEGANGLRIDSAKDLVLDTRFGEIRQSDLFAYQFEEGSRSEAKCTYQSKKNGDVGFEVKWKNREEDLIIDPIIWATYFGGTGSDEIISVQTNSEDNIVVAGRYFYAELPNYSGVYESYQSEFSNFTSYFVSSIDSSATNMNFLTSIGGDGIEYLTKMKISSNGNLCIVGYTRSDDFPTSIGAFSSVNSSESPSLNEDGILCVLSPTGDALLYSSYLGGDRDDKIFDFDFNEGNGIYLVGTTKSFNFPTTPESFDNTLDGFQCFISLLNTDSSELVFSSSFGGSTAGEDAFGMTVDEVGCVYIVGRTLSENFPTTSDAFDASFNGFYDGYICKFDSLCSELIYSSFLGGEDDDALYDLTIVDEMGIYCVGYTKSTDFSLPGSPFDSTFNGMTDILLLRLGIEDAAVLDYTLLGGSLNDYAFDLVVDCSQNIIVAGYSASPEFPTTLNSYSQDIQSTIDAIVVKLNSILNEIIYSSFIGGISTEAINDIVYDSNGYLLAVGSSSSLDFPTTSGVISMSVNETEDELEFPDSDGFILKMDFCPTAHVYSNAPFCEGGTLQLSATGGNTYSWTGPDGFQENGSEVEVVNPVTGTYIVSSASGGTVIDVCTGNGSCTDTASVYVEVYALPEVSFLLADTICVESGNLNLAGGFPGGGTYTGAGITGNTFSPQSAGVGDHILQYYFTDEHGCSNVAAADVAVVVCTNVYELDNRISPTIFPNPFKDEIQLSSLEIIKQIRIYNGIGELVHQQKIEKSIFTLNLEHLESGIYTIEVDVISGKKYSERLVKG